MYVRDFTGLISCNPIPHRYEGKCLDPSKLVRLLREQYGPSNFRIDLQLDQYIVYVPPAKSRPSGLTDDEIDTCRSRY
ncbi:hypothetical protein BJY01DRAFT_230347 [Aspergillus pseudoustus]|uniref:Uncharacterized protein n=1 Tax=Aspergillus pseudoustus TaxID=1810923 RepID=A0ABR4IB36_9EURO